MGQMSNVVFGPDVKCRYVGHISMTDLDPHLKSISNIFDKNPNVFPYRKVIYSHICETLLNILKYIFKMHNIKLILCV